MPWTTLITMEEHSGLMKPMSNAAMTNLLQTEAGMAATGAAVHQEAIIKDVIKPVSSLLNNIIIFNLGNYTVSFQ